MSSPDTIPCSCCDGEATHRGADGFYRCEKHRLAADLAPFEVAVVETLRAQLAAMTRHRDDLLEICRRESEAAHDAVLSGRKNKLKCGAMLMRDALAELVQQRDAAVRKCEALAKSYGDECDVQDQCEGGHDVPGVAFSADDVWLCKECLDACTEAGRRA